MKCRTGLWSVILAVGHAFSVSCTKTPSPPVFQLQTTTCCATGVELHAVTLTGTVTTNGVRAVIDKGFCWDTLPSPLLTHHAWSAGPDTGTFTVKIDDLKASTTYYFRTYARTDLGVDYGNELSIRTLGWPEVRLRAIDSIWTNSARIIARVAADGGSPVTDRGVYWSTFGDPVLNGTKRSAGADTGDFTVRLTGLQSGTPYFVRAYVTTLAGTVQDTVWTFTTIDLPDIAGATASEVGTDRARLNGRILSNGHTSITELGFYWAAHAGVTTSDQLLTMPVQDTGAFSALLTGLVPNTTYHVRPFARNKVGVSMGAESSFSTGTIALPSVVTGSITGVGYNDATLSGEVLGDGGAAVTERGICWQILYNPQNLPSINGNHQALGAGVGKFSITVNGLMDNTPYQVRAYATNATGTAYGATAIFTTSPAPTPAPYLQLPVNGQEYLIAGEYSFTWSGLTASVNAFQIQFSTVADFNAPLRSLPDGGCTFSTARLVSGQVNAITTYQVGSMSMCVKFDSNAQNGTWYWRVRSENAFGQPSAWSSVRSFTVSIP